MGDHGAEEDDSDLESTPIEIAGVKGPANKKNRKKKNKSTTGNLSSTAQFGFKGPKCFKLEILEGKGRALVACGKIASGTTFFKETPMAAVAHNPGGLCYNCARCSSSRITADDPVEEGANWFCSKKCYSSAQENTQRYRFMRQVGDVVADVAAAHSCDRDLLRMIFQLLSQQLFPSTSPPQAESAGPMCTESADGVLHATSAGVAALEAHLDQQPLEWVRAVSAAIRAILEHLASTDVALDAADIEMRALRLACVVNTNAYGITEHTETGSQLALGFGLFPAVGLCVNHSCLPNSYYAYNGSAGCMEYRLLRDVQSGEELTVSYVDVFQDTASRQRDIMATRFFQCTCSRCAGWELAVQTATDICRRCATDTNAIQGGKKNPKDDGWKRDLSPFYQSPPTAAAAQEAMDAWIDQEFGEASARAGGGKAGTNSGGKGKKGKTSAQVGSAGAKEGTGVASGSGGSAAKSSSGAPTGEDKERLARILADASMGGLHCEVCAATGLRGVVIPVPVPPSHARGQGEGEAAGEGCASCIVCCSPVDWKAVSTSLERCRSEWKVCQDTVRYTPAGAAAVTHIERYLQEADPEYAQYTSCSLTGEELHTTRGAAKDVAVTAHAAAAERRRRARCPVQLHADNAMIVQAYLLLHEHLTADPTALSAGSTSPGSAAARALYALRRVVRARRGLFLPHLHPEVAAVQWWLVALLGTVARSCQKASLTYTALQQERKTLLDEIITCRRTAYGSEHTLVRQAEAELASIVVR